MMQALLTLLIAGPLLCSSDQDCPVGASCHYGECVHRVGAAKVPPKAKAPAQPKPEPKAEVAEKPQLDLSVSLWECSRRDCAARGGECYQGRCGPPVPSSGTGLTIAGSITTAASLVWIALAAVGCVAADRSFNDGETLECAAPFLVVGGISALVGLPMMLVGISKADSFREWLSVHHP